MVTENKHGGFEVEELTAYCRTTARDNNFILSIPPQIIHLRSRTSIILLLLKMEYGEFYYERIFW